MNKHAMREDCAFFKVPKTNSFATLPADFYTRLPTTALKDPVLVHTNPQVGALLGLTPEHLCSQAFLDIVSGSSALPGGDTLSAVYSGHQFVL